MSTRAIDMASERSSMRFILFILFIVMPFVEIALLIKLGELLGFWLTIGIVIATAVIGAYVLQAQGAATLRRVSQSLVSGEAPIMPVVDGFFLAISGAFLLTPGVVTDGIGLLLLVPPVRHAIARWGFGRIAKSGNFTVHTYTTDGSSEEVFGSGNERSGRRSGQAPQGRRPGSGSGPVIDGEYEEIKDKKS